MKLNIRTLFFWQEGDRLVAQEEDESSVKETEARGGRGVSEVWGRHSLGGGLPAAGLWGTLQWISRDGWVGFCWFETIETISLFCLSSWRGQRVIVWMFWKFTFCLFFSTFSAIYCMFLFQTIHILKHSAQSGQSCCHFWYLCNFSFWNI